MIETVAKLSMVGLFAARWSDPNRRCYRIHTKHLTTEATP